MWRAQHMWNSSAATHIHSHTHTQRSVCVCKGKKAGQGCGRGAVWERTFWERREIIQHFLLHLIRTRAFSLLHRFPRRHKEALIQPSFCSTLSVTAFTGATRNTQIKTLKPEGCRVSPVSEKAADCWTFQLWHLLTDVYGTKFGDLLFYSLLQDLFWRLSMPFFLFWRK